MLPIFHSECGPQCLFQHIGTYCLVPASHLIAEIRAPPIKLAGGVHADPVARSTNKASQCPFGTCLPANHACTLRNVFPVALHHRCPLFSPSRYYTTTVSFYLTPETGMAHHAPTANLF